MNTSYVGKVLRLTSSTANKVRGRGSNPSTMSYIGNKQIKEASINGIRTTLSAQGRGSTTYIDLVIGQNFPASVLAQIENGR